MQGAGVGQLELAEVVRMGDLEGGLARGKSVADSIEMNGAPCWMREVNYS